MSVTEGAPEKDGLTDGKWVRDGSFEMDGEMEGDSVKLGTCERDGWLESLGTLEGVTDKIVGSGLTVGIGALLGATVGAVGEEVHVTPFPTKPVRRERGRG